MSEAEKSPESIKTEWPKELLDLLQKAGPLWSAVLGLVMLMGGAYVDARPLAGTGIGILVVGFLLFVSRKPSQFTRAGAFFDLRELFVGREKDRKKLADAVRNTPSLWLTGESGSGKSSLLQRGLIPLLTEGPDYLPVYVNNWGVDWELGPVAEVTAALRHTAEGLGAKWQADAVTGAANLSTLLRRAAEVFTRTPLLMFDQFDDYVVANIRRFRPEGAGLTITTADLESQNGFWREIAGLVRNGEIRCIFVVRDEQGWGQSAVSFVPLREFFLPRLERAYFDRLIEPEGKTIVENSDRGWTDLKERLKKDLYENGGILPIQMRIVLERLASLRALTVREYERHEGALGLAADYIQETIDRTVRAARAEPATIRRILASMVNPIDKTKTRDVSIEDLANCLTGAVRGDSINAILEELKREDIVRDRADESGAARWRFDHDYLARAFGALQSREQAGRQILEYYIERARAPGLWRKRLALILPRDLGRILVDRARGRISVRGGRVVVAASAAFWIGALGIAGFAAYTSDANVFAARIDAYVPYLDHGDQLVSLDEAKKWDELAVEPLPVRRGVAQRLLADQTAAQRLTSLGPRRRMAAAAFGGLSRRAQRQFEFPVCGIAVSAACLFMAAEFGQEAESVLDRRAHDPKMLSIPSFDDHDLLQELGRFAGSAAIDRYCAPLSQGGSRAGCFSLPSLLAPPFVPEAKGTKDISKLLQDTHSSDYFLRNSSANELVALVPAMNAEQKKTTARELLAASRESGECVYATELVSADIRTAIEALADPMCAADKGPQLQRAITDATTHKPVGDVDRWTFALEWVEPNAAKYGYDPERFNKFYYCYIQPFLQSLNPFGRGIKL